MNEIQKCQFTHIFSFSCDIDNKNIKSFEWLFISGMCFTIIAMVSSFYVKKVPPKPLVCTFINLALIINNFMHFDNEVNVVLCPIWTYASQVSG